MQTKTSGLTSAQAAQRLAQLGENKLKGKSPTSTAEMFFSQFKDVMILILAVATLVSVLMGQGAEAITIIIIVIMNALMGFFQEYRTEKTLEALKELSAPIACVRRDGTLQRINARHVVQGDVLVVRAGDKIAADATVRTAQSVQCDESMLTGESQGVEKQVGARMYAGCIVTAGNAECIVTATGMDTEMGKIANLMNQADESPTPLQRKLKQLGKFIAFLCVTICLAVGFLGYLQGNDFLAMLLTGVSLAVAAIPEGLPAIVTITLALSVNRILRRGAVIRKLHAVETLGAAGVICSDKTGTITQNKMTVQEIVTYDDTYCVAKHHSLPRTMMQLVQSAVLCTAPTSDLAQAQGDATELAVLALANTVGITKQNLSHTFNMVSSMPFDAQRKRMSVVVRTAKATQLICKGAPEMLLPLCTHVHTSDGVRPMTASDRNALNATLATLAAKALRVLGVAVSDTPNKGEQALCFLGFFAMQDPPRPEVAPAVRKCRTAGIKPVMITGDHRDTALAIARSVGIARAGDGVLEGEQIEQMTDEQLASACMQTSVYARVSPAHKLRIVKAYQASGQVTAMTGDGVNDAPAVLQADIGVAMGITGTDVTKEASGVVLLDDNFATIVSAVEEGRVIYQNIRRFIRFLLTSNLGEVTGMLFAMLLQLPVALMPIQILLVNLFTDGLPAVALGMEPPSAGLMQRPPRKKDESLFAHGLGRTIVWRGLLLGLTSCSAYWAVYTQSGDLAIARSACFLAIVFSQMIHIFECRGKGTAVYGNVWLLLAVTSSLLCTVLSVYVPALQTVFGMASVTGVHLLTVMGCVSVMPLLFALWNVFSKQAHDD